MQQAPPLPSTRSERKKEAALQTMRKKAFNMVHFAPPPALSYGKAPERR
jgi:hypothetical protein